MLKEAEDEKDPVQKRVKRRLWIAYLNKLMSSWKYGYRTPLLILLFAVSAYGGETKEKTHRMEQIEKKFGIKMAFVWKDDDGTKRWIFVKPSQTITQFFAIAVPVNATDSQVDVARHAAEFCNQCDGELFKRYLETHHPETETPIPKFQ